MADKNRELEEINQYINEYDRIYVSTNKDFTYTSFLCDIPLPAAKKYLLLVAGLEKECISENGIDIRSISYEKYDKIKSLYYLYEFSDRVYFLDAPIQCGSLGNYIINGLLTKDEAIMALLK